MNRKVIVCGITAIIVVLLLFIYVTPSLRRDAQTTTVAVMARWGVHLPIPFPDIDVASLTPLQRKIITVARSEYAKHPVSYDATVLKYSQGEKQAWCADFISWVMKQSGAAYTNPHSQGWRIPGVFTLQEYYQAHHRYIKAGQYKPKPGDVAFYIHKSTFVRLNREHVALVIKVDGNEMTTLGGNEGGKMQINTRSITAGANNLAGFGRL